MKTRSAQAEREYDLRSNRGNKLRIAPKSKTIPKRSTKSISKKAPRKLTTVRMDKIEKFLIRNYSNPEKFSFGSIGSQKWNLELLKYLNEPAFRDLGTSDVEYWVKTSKDFFKQVRGRAERKVKKSRNDSEGNSSGGRSSSTSSNGISTSGSDSICSSPNHYDSGHEGDDSSYGTATPDLTPKTKVPTAEGQADVRADTSSSGTQKGVEVQVNKENGSGAADTQVVTLAEINKGIKTPRVELGVDYTILESGAIIPINLDSLMMTSEQIENIVQQPVDLTQFQDPPQSTSVAAVLQNQTPLTSAATVLQNQTPPTSAPAAFQDQTPSTSAPAVADLTELQKLIANNAVELIGGISHIGELPESLIHFVESGILPANLESLQLLSKMHLIFVGKLREQGIYSDKLLQMCTLVAQLFQMIATFS